MHLSNTNLILNTRVVTILRTQYMFNGDLHLRLIANDTAQKEDPTESALESIK